MKNHLESALAAQRQLRLAVDALANAWSEDPATRNRSGRQRLTAELMAHLPNAFAFGRTIDRIARECEVEL